MRLSLAAGSLWIGIASSAVPIAASHAQISVVGNSIQERQSPPAGTYSGSVSVKNNGSQPQTVRAYLTDYSFSAAGTVEFKEPGTTRRSNASWLTLSPGELTVGPHESGTFTYTVAVPALRGDSATGSYWSVLMVEAHSASSSARIATGVQVRAVMRQGIQLVTHIGSAGAASVALTNARLVPDSTGTALVFDAANDGVRARRLSLSLDLYSDDGKFVGRFTKERGLVYPGSSIRQSFSLGHLKKGNYLAFVVADAGQDDLFAGNFKLTL